uniref:Uncharacterized protein n=1 Tax=viral metagenome TaxID=1070528 RepID=A0A6C0JU46_9ZZZZ
MALWSNTDANTSIPKFAPSLVKLSNSQANNDLLYANTTQDAFIAGQIVGVFGVSPGEKAGVGNVSAVAVTTAGDSAYGKPTVTITGANTTQATVTSNLKLVSASIHAAGSGYANGNTFQVHAGTNTTTAVLTVTNVGAIGNITGISVTTAGKYSTITTSNINTLTVNTASGTGFSANLRFGFESITVSAAGAGYNVSTVGAVASGNGILNTAFTVTLTGQEGTDKGALAGWNLRTEGTGNRAGRVRYECLVAMGSMTGDAADDTQLAE